MAPYAEFVFATAPFEVRGPSDEIIERLYQDHAPFYEWGHINKLEPEGSDNGWYHQYVGFDRVVEHIDKQIQDHGPFDAVIGFSQGGQMITALSMWYLHQRNERYALFAQALEYATLACVRSSSTRMAGPTAYRSPRFTSSARRTSTTTLAVNTPICTLTMHQDRH